MAGQPIGDDVSFGDVNGPLAYWGPAGDGAAHQARLHHLRAAAETGEGGFGDLNGPLVYWGPARGMARTSRALPRQAFVRLSA